MNEQRLQSIEEARLCRLIDKLKFENDRVVDELEEVRIKLQQTEDMRSKLLSTQADAAAMRDALKLLHPRADVWRTPGDTDARAIEAALSSSPGAPLLEALRMAKEALREMIRTIIDESNAAHSISGRMGARLCDAREALAKLNEVGI